MNLNAATVSHPQVIPQRMCWAAWSCLGPRAWAAPAVPWGDWLDVGSDAGKKLKASQLLHQCPLFDLPTLMRAGTVTRAMRALRLSITGSKYNPPGLETLGGSRLAFTASAPEPGSPQGSLPCVAQRPVPARSGLLPLQEPTVTSWGDNRSPMTP